MKKIGQNFELSASDLVAHLNCRHLSALERAVAEGALKRPYLSDPLLKALWERGLIHEQSYLEHLTKAGFDVVRIDGSRSLPHRLRKPWPRRSGVYP